MLDADISAREHLATIHDLRDDPGTASQVIDLVHLQPLASPELAPVDADGAEDAVAPPVLGEAFRGSHVYDPTADDQRWRTVTIAVGGLVVLVFVLVALLFPR